MEAVVPVIFLKTLCGYERRTRYKIRLRGVVIRTGKTTAGTASIDSRYLILSGGRAFAGVGGSFGGGSRNRSGHGGTPYDRHGSKTN
jgi:hypothetical protein